MFTDSLIDLIRSNLTTIEIYHGMYGAEKPPARIVQLIRLNRNLTDKAISTGDLDRYTYCKELLRKVVRFEALFDLTLMQPVPKLKGSMRALGVPPPHNYNVTFNQ